LRLFSCGGVRVRVRVSSLCPGIAAGVDVRFGIFSSPQQRQQDDDGGDFGAGSMLLRDGASPSSTPSLSEVVGFRVFWVKDLELSQETVVLWPLPFSEHDEFRESADDSRFSKVLDSSPW
jgi:hypothetical protein